MKIAIPASVWRARTVFRASGHVGWDAEPAGLICIRWGSDWADRGHTLIAEVPSAVVPEEANILINPRHGDAKHLRPRKVRRWTYDPRLTRLRDPAH